MYCPISFDIFRILQLYFGIFRLISVDSKFAYKLQIHQKISLLIIKSQGTSNGKIGHFLATLFADSIPFPYDIP
jgi:hypothetical protein